MTEQSEGPGRVLRAEREALGVTTRDVAETLNLSINMVEAIEADDYERMPAVVFARGYIRAYARLLDLDPEPIVARYPESGVANDSPEGVQAAGLAERLRRHPQLVTGGLAVLALLLVLIIGAWLWPDDEPGPSGADAASGPATPAATSAMPPTAAPESGVPADTAAQQPVSEPSVDPVSGTITEAPTEAEAAPAETETAPAGAAASAAAIDEAVPAQPTADSAESAGAVRRITEFGDDELRFDFTEDCWVEVKSSTGRNLYSDLSRAGSSLALVGEGPFRILLGYAPGATVAFNGEQVALAPHTRNNVASLVLGQ